VHCSTAEHASSFRITRVGTPVQRFCNKPTVVVVLTPDSSAGQVWQYCYKPVVAKCAGRYVYCADTIKHFTDSTTDLHEQIRSDCFDGSSWRMLLDTYCKFWYITARHASALYSGDSEHSIVMVLQARHVSWYLAVGCSSIAHSADLCNAGMQFRDVQQKHASICST
jgi:hypothetical protein